MGVVSSDEVVKQPSESILYYFAFRYTDSAGVAHGLLSSGETISGVTGVTIQEKDPSGSADCTIGTPTAIAAETTVDGRTMAANQAVQVRLSEGIDATDYLLQCTVTTSDSNTRAMDGVLKVRNGAL